MEQATGLPPALLVLTKHVQNFITETWQLPNHGWKLKLKLLSYKQTQLSLRLFIKNAQTYREWFGQGFFQIKMKLFNKYWIVQVLTYFVDVEGMKDMKRMITLLGITSQFIPTNRRGSERLRKLVDRVRKQMLINTHKVNRCKQMWTASLGCSHGRE